MGRRISAILPVYNEELILKECLNNLEPYVDEIVLIDGSPYGKSTDETASIAKSFRKVVYLSGTFKTIPGAWDVTTQKNLAITEATGDVLLFISADMYFYNLKLLREVIDSNYKVFYCPTVEFWMDTNHIRLSNYIANLSVSGIINQAFAIDRKLQPLFGDNRQLDVVEHKPTESIMIMDIIKYHFGWVRPFPQQVAKHIRHVRQGAWGEKSKELMGGTEQKLEQWAILHVISYPQAPHIKINKIKLEGIDSMMSMSYTIGQEDTINEYKKKYGTNLFRGI